MGEATRLVAASPSRLQVQVNGVPSVVALVLAIGLTFSLLLVISLRRWLYRHTDEDGRAALHFAVAVVAVITLCALTGFLWTYGLRFVWRTWVWVPGSIAIWQLARYTQTLRRWLQGRR